MYQATTLPVNKPTKNPTTNPTKNPTANPTTNPTKGPRQQVVVPLSLIQFAAEASIWEPKSNEWIIKVKQVPLAIYKLTGVQFDQTVTPDNWLA